MSSAGAQGSRDLILAAMIFAVAMTFIDQTIVSRPVTEHRPARMDYRGLALIASGVGLSVFGFQQSSI